MKKTERIIHLDEMLIYVLRRWKLFMVIVIISGFIFGSIGVYKVNKKYKTSEKEEQGATVAVTVSENEVNSINTILNLEQLISEQKEYNKNSILMKINPYEKIVASIRYQFQVTGDMTLELQESRLEQGKKAYQCVFNNEEVYKFIKDSLLMDVDEKYLNELISLETESKGIIVINVAAPDEEMAKKIQNAIEDYLSLNCKKILNNYKDLIVMLDSKYIVSKIDTGLQGLQTTQYANPQNMQAQVDTQYQQLSDNAKQYLALAKVSYQEGHYKSGQTLYKETKPNREVGLTRRLYEAGVYAAKRIIVLVCLFIAYLALKYMWSSKLMYEYDIYDMFGICIIDILTTSDDERINLVAEKIFSCISGDNCVALISSSGEDKILKVLENLKLALEEKGIVIYIMTEPGNDDLIQLIRNPFDVILIEGIGISRYNRIEGILRDVKGLGKNVKGSVVIKDILSNKR